jgi:dimethylhistidine N-methyltransferase
MEMMPVSTPLFIQTHHINDAALRQDLIKGLQQVPASVSPKFFYDDLGSKLFTAITELAEYYPTRTEAAIFAAHGTSMAAHIPQQAVMLDLGAGCCTKASRLFPVLMPDAYVAVDIAVDFLRDTLTALAQQHPHLSMMGLGLDFSTTLELPGEAQAWLEQQQHGHKPKVVFYPGSSIGNFSPSHALRLLQQARDLCHGTKGQGSAGGGLLIGVDLVKPASVLEPAYDDNLGVTAAFNRNALLHINRILGSNFEPRLWQHVALFNTTESRIEMHLQSQIAQTVQWPGGHRAFQSGERIHTESSYKWTVESFEQLLKQAGFTPQQCWTDPQNWFGVFWASA